MVWTRQTYSLLDWLGDLGGLLDILFYIGAALVEPVAHFTLNTTLMTSFFRFKKSKPPRSQRLQKSKGKNNSTSRDGHDRDYPRPSTLLEKVKTEFLAS